MFQIIVHWIDFIWLPMTFFYMDKDHRPYALGFVLACIFGLRLEEELLQSMGYSAGITGWISFPSYFRGLITYSVAIALFLTLSYFSKKTHNVVYMAACISIFIAVFIISLLIMVV